MEGLNATVLKVVGEPEFHPASSALGASGTLDETRANPLRKEYSREHQYGNHHNAPAAPNRGAEQFPLKFGAALPIQRVGRLTHAAVLDPME